MSDREWRTFRLYGRELRVRQEDDCWRLLVPSHVALRLALAILNAEPGAEIA